MDRLKRLWPDIKPTLLFWTETEVHVYSFSVAANVLLSFFPFLVVATSIIRYALHWFGVEQGIYLALRDYFPGETGAFIVRNLQATIYKHGQALSMFSMILLLFTANGIFMPLEVALNRIWGISKNRSFLKNQLVSQGLILGCGFLWLATSVAASPVVKIGWLSAIVYKLASLPVTIGIVFLTYWLLPNGRVPPLLVFIAAIFVGVSIEAMKLLNWLIWPWLNEKMMREYAPFAHSVTIIIWSFIFSMLVLGGADWSARKAREMNLTVSSID
ncbi:YihY/virulence factor BrkB family protein [Bryobacter aggregatus]|uniref:YihY/virulence factor BrkB family protein n=1 Tax=Bryobacter aggregatus TaxID=360054 RepID=UPI00068BB54A|nr:YihY/virulence factor BrkB family protein [Bryobacter aggregatus]